MSDQSGRRWSRSRILEGRETDKLLTEGAANRKKVELSDSAGKGYQGGSSGRRRMSHEVIILSDEDEFNNDGCCHVNEIIDKRERHKKKRSRWLNLASPANEESSEDSGGDPWDDEGIDQFLTGGRHHDHARIVPKKIEKKFTAHDLIMGKYYDDHQIQYDDHVGPTTTIVKLLGMLGSLVFFVVLGILAPIIFMRNIFVDSSPGFVLVLVFGPTLLIYGLIVLSQVYEQDRTKLY
eukprot:GHVH01008122.1.p1 GENE.GHVH01008122.1~~GHVH01008122.1.p1  ORF type:complete len:236 (-),score=30.11 GHVH01008122.1:837-1544(-)